MAKRYLTLTSLDEALHEHVGLNHAVRIQLDVGRRYHDVAEIMLLDVGAEPRGQSEDRFLVHHPRGWRHQVFPVHDLVPETVVGERADPLRGPELGCLRHVHIVLGSALR